MRVLILGGDGCLGWPTAMFLSSGGHEVAGVNNYFRRRACPEHNRDPLFPMPNLHQRPALREAFRRLPGWRPYRRFLHISFAFEDFPPIPARRGDPLRRTARGALLHDGPSRILCVHLILCREAQS